MSPKKDKPEPEPDSPSTGVAEPGPVPAPIPTQEEKLMALFLEGDVSTMKPQERAQYCWKLAESVGLNPLTKPFDIIPLGGKTVVYANRTAADQIRKIRGITSKILYHGPLVLGTTLVKDKDGNQQQIPNFRPDVYQVIVEMTDKEGRVETATGCVNVKDYSGEALSNQIMKCWTKAMRRGTLSMGGLGFLDELEVDTIRPSSGSPNAPDDYQPVLPKPQPQPTLAPAPAPAVEAVVVAPIPLVNLVEGGEAPAAAPPHPVVAAPTLVKPSTPSGPRPLPKVEKPQRGV